MSTNSQDQNHPRSPKYFEDRLEIENEKVLDELEKIRRQPEGTRLRIYGTAETWEIMGLPESFVRSQPRRRLAIDEIRDTDEGGCW